MPIDWEFARIDRLVSICLDLKRMGHAADDDLGSTWFELAARRHDMTAGPDVVRLNRSLSHYRAVDAQDNATGSSVRAVHSALLSHHTIVTPPTVVLRKASLVRSYMPTLKPVPGDQARSPAGIVYSAP